MTTPSSDRPKLNDLSMDELLNQLADVREARQAIGRLRLRCNLEARDAKMHATEVALIGLESDLFDELRSSFRATAHKEIEDRLA